jgi:hypothetical protein
MIAEFQSRRFLRQRLDLVFAQETVDLRNGGRREAELASQNCFQLFEYDLSGYQFMFFDDKKENVIAKAAGVKGASKNIGVEEHFQDTTLNTSSSVKKPRASANGMARRRSCWKRRTARWRLKASRITSLRVCPDPLRTSSRAGNRSSSIRTVMVFPFMCYMVAHVRNLWHLA